MLIGVALARILGPDQFGTFAVAWVSVIAVLSLNDVGVSLAIVRWREEPDVLAPTVNTIAGGMSIIFALTMVVGAGPFAQAMGDPAATALVRWLALCVVIDGLVATPAATLQRTFRQDQRMVIDQVNVWIGALLSIGFALAGFGAVSLVIGRLAGSVVSAGLFLHFSPVKYRFDFDRALAGRLARFGLPLAGTSMLVFAIGFVDQIIVGHRLGPRELAFYVQAFNLASWPVSIISGPLRSVAPALFARLNPDPADRATAFASILRPLLAVALPSCVGIAAAAGPLVRVVYGEQWAATAGPLRWLAVFAALRILFELFYDYIVVAGRTVHLLAIQLSWAVVLVPAALVGVAMGGAPGVALAVTLVGMVLVLPLYGVALSRLDIHVVRAAKGVLPTLVLTLLLAALVALFDRAGWGSLPQLLVGGLAGVLCVGVLLSLHRSDLRAWRTRPDEPLS
jgi:PST family polysaccharide transporter